VKRYLFIFLVLSVCSSGSKAQAPTASCHATANSSSLNCALSVVTGQKIIAAGWTYSGAGSLCNGFVHVTDSQSNSFPDPNNTGNGGCFPTVLFGDSSHNRTLVITCGTAGSTGTDTVTLTQNVTIVATNMEIVVLAYTGITSCTPQIPGGGVSFYVKGDPNSTVSTGSMSINATAIAIVLSSIAGGTTPATSGGFTVEVTEAGHAMFGFDYWCQMADQFITSNGNYTATYTGGASTWQMIGIAFPYASPSSGRRHTKVIRLPDPKRAPKIPWIFRRDELKIVTI